MIAVSFRLRVFDVTKGREKTEKVIGFERLPFSIRISETIPLSVPIPEIVFRLLIWFAAGDCDLIR